MSEEDKKDIIIKTLEKRVEELEQQNSNLRNVAISLRRLVPIATWVDPRKEETEGEYENQDYSDKTAGTDRMSRCEHCKRLHPEADECADWNQDREMLGNIEEADD